MTCEIDLLNIKLKFSYDVESKYSSELNNTFAAASTGRYGDTRGMGF